MEKELISGQMVQNTQEITSMEKNKGMVSSTIIVVNDMKDNGLMENNKEKVKQSRKISKCKRREFGKKENQSHQHRFLLMKLSNIRKFKDPISKIFRLKVEVKIKIEVIFKLILINPLVIDHNCSYMIF